MLHRRFKLLLLFSLLLFWEQPAWSQKVLSSSSPQFETVSVRKNVSGHGVQITYSADGYIATGLPLQPTIVNAYSYRLGDPQFMTGQKVIPGAPGWVTSDPYDIYAKVSEADAANFQTMPEMERVRRIRLMLQAMLADRFQLRVNRSTENTPGYALVVSSKGSKLTASTHNGGLLATLGKITSRGADIRGLVFALTGALHAPVIDKTGLTGKYDFTLTYSPDELQAGTNVSPIADTRLSIFTAMQEQLGLKLQRTTVPTEGLTNAHIERPSEN